MDILKLNMEKYIKLKNSDKLVIIDFWAPWCAPCKWMAPVFDKVAEEYGEKIVFASVNVDDERDLANDFGVRGIPYIVFIKGGKKVDEIVGFVPKEAFKEKIEQFLK